MVAAVSSMERRVTSMIGQPCRPQSFARVGDLFLNAGAVGVRLEVAIGQQHRAIASDLGNALGRGNEAGDERLMRLGQLWRQWQRGHQRQVRGLIAALGKIDAGRRLGRARDAEQNDVGGVQILRQAAVIVGHREVQRVDAAEIVGVEHVLSGDCRRLRCAEIALEHLHDRLQDVQARNLQLAAAALQLLRQLLIDNRIEDDAGRLLDLLQHPLQLSGRAHERMHVLDRTELRILNGRGLGDGRQRLACRVGNEMDVKVARRRGGHLWKKVRVIQGRSGRTGLCSLGCSPVHGVVPKRRRR